MREKKNINTNECIGNPREREREHLGGLVFRNALQIRTHKPLELAQHLC